MDFGHQTAKFVTTMVCHLDKSVSSLEESPLSEEVPNPEKVLNVQ